MNDATKSPKILAEGRLLWIVALPLEARPLIEWLGLKKSRRETRFPVYENERHALIISGTGKTKAAIAATWLYARQKKAIALINFGFCGTGERGLSPGRLVLCDQIIDRDTGNHHYPDYFFDCSLPRRTLECHPYPVTAAAMADAVACADMESAGIMETARKFFATQQIMILKVVSDPLQPHQLTQKKLKTLLAQAVTKLDPIVTCFREQAQSRPDPLTLELSDMLAVLQSRLQLTVSQRQEAGTFLHRALVAGLCRERIEKFFPASADRTKAASKDALQKLREQLNHALSNPLP